ncbi:mitotic spindle assembly checkpoint protein MAD1 [Cloeon dipterum]|uniref:mitotic spindle assembly checkpoint protein MAD1 n=1 Tax=Cloeon dipterum TaxID=197152 RepID=UPI0032205E1E
MAERRKSQITQELIENFRQQDSAARPRVGISTHNFLGNTSTSCMDETIHVTKKLLFDGSMASNTSFSVPTDQLLRSATKRKSVTLDGGDFQSPIKRVPTTPGGGIDWSPVCREQRKTLVESLDSRINDLQAMAMKQQSFKKQMLEVIDTEKMLLNRQKEKDKLIVKNMQEQLESMRKKKEETEDALLAAESMLREQKFKAEQEKCNWQRDYSSLENKHSELVSQHQIMESGLKHKISMLELDLKTTNSINQELQTHLSCLQDEVKEMREVRIQEQAYREQLELKELRIRGLEEELASKRDSLRIERQSASANASTSRKNLELEEQLVQTKELLRGKLLLEERVNSLQEQASKVDQLTQKCATYEQLLKTKDSELKEWHALAINSVSESNNEHLSARNVSTTIQNLEQSSLVLRSNLSEAVSQLKSAKREKEAVEAVLRNEQERRMTIESSAVAQAATLRKMERKLQLIVQERDSIQQVLSAYEGDMTTIPNQMQILQQKRIESAERSAKEMREMVQKMEQELAQYKMGNANPANREFTALQEKLQLAENELHKAKARAVALEETNERLEMLLERRALRGDYDPAQTKVMHFRMNPMAQDDAKKADEIKRLKEDNDKLREKVKLLRSKESSSMLNVTAAADENFHIESNKQIGELQNKLKSTELHNTRLKEAFKKTSQNFRQALYLILGYKMDGCKDGTYKLTSMYSDSNDHLLFKVKEDDTVEMLETPFAETIQELIRLHLNEQGSIPAFLSALTLDLFSQQSFAS